MCSLAFFRKHWPECKNNDEDNSLNMLKDKNYPASSQKFRQIMLGKSLKCL